MRRVLGLTILSLALMVFGLTSQGALAGMSHQLSVAVSILPLADFTRNVGGDRIRATVLVPPGSSPHTYEPTPARARTIATAEVLVLNGLGLEFWADKLIDAANNPDLIVVRTAECLEIMEVENGGAHHAEDRDKRSHHHVKGNPHVWLDPIHAIYQVKKIRDALIQADPDGADTYRRNTDRYIMQLKALDSEIRGTVATFASKKFISFHAGYTYFAHRYGLQQVTVVERTPGREPSPKEIAAIVRTAREFKIKAIFAEPQFSPKAAQVIAEECGAEVFFLNPLGDPPDFVYLETMRKNLHELVEALRGED